MILQYFICNLRITSWLLRNSLLPVYLISTKKKKNLKKSKICRAVYWCFLRNIYYKSVANDKKLNIKLAHKTILFYILTKRQVSQFIYVFNATVLWCVLKIKNTFVFAHNFAQNLKQGISCLDNVILAIF